MTTRQRLEAFVEHDRQRRAEFGPFCPIEYDYQPLSRRAAFILWLRSDGWAIPALALLVSLIVIGWFLL